jgi:hypothetical protein
MSPEEITITLGEEYDERLWAALRVVLLRNGAVEVERSWGVGGSQEITTLTVQVNQAVVRVVAETYMGLSLVGPCSIVEPLAQQVRDEPR